MKAHHVAAIALLVILTGAGYVITVWQQSTLPHEEEHVDKTHDSESSTDHGNSTASNDHLGTTSESPGTTSAPTTTITNTSSSEAAVALAEANIDMTVTVHASDPPSITIQFKASQDLNLDGWRIGDAIGVSGLTDHLYYFSDLQLTAGDTLTVSSTCGSDQALSRYWCLTNSRTLAESVASRGIFFVDSKGEVAISCTPMEDDASRFQCL